MRQAVILLNNEEIIERITSAEERGKSNTKRIDTLELTVQDIHTLARSVAVLAQQMKTMNEDLSEIKSTVSDVTSKPTETAEKIKWIVVTALCSAGISAVITYICTLF